jgi:hypothetical protein
MKALQAALVLWHVEALVLFTVSHQLVADKTPRKTTR